MGFRPQRTVFSPSADFRGVSGGGQRAKTPVVLLLAL